MFTYEPSLESPSKPFVVRVGDKTFRCSHTTLTQALITGMAALTTASFPTAKTRKPHTPRKKQPLFCGYCGTRKGNGHSETCRFKDNPTWVKQEPK